MKVASINFVGCQDLLHPALIQQLASSQMEAGARVGHISVPKRNFVVCQYFLSRPHTTARWLEAGEGKVTA